METIRATVTKIVFHKEDSGFKVLVTRLLNNKSLIITGDFGPEIIPESIADFHGDYTTHQKYGHQFKAKACTIVHNAEELESIKIFLDTIAPNIGLERASMIVNHFKMNIVEILDKSPDRLLEVQGIGKVSSNSLIEAWKKNRVKWDEERTVYNLRAFLGSLGLKERKVKKVLSYFGSKAFDAENRIKENPYELIEIDGFGFTTVDFIARRLGITEDSPERLRAFIIYCLEIICPSFGHLFFTIPEILNSIRSYCSENNTKFIGKDIVLEDIKNSLETLKEKLVVEEDNVYSQKQFNFEQGSAILLNQIMNTESDLIFLNKGAVEDFIERFEHDHGLVLSEEQRRALFYFAEKKVFVLTGPPGSGKTSTLKAVIDLAKLMHLRLTCMTPTGISAKKLATTIEGEAYTIHRILGFRGNEWTYNENNQFDTDVVVIDESSMMDQEVFYRMLSALKKRVHLIFVGDHNQLPSVGAGNVLRELINCDAVPTVVLDKIFRQDEASDIIKAAHQIIHGDTSLSLFKEDPTADILFLRIKDIQEIENVIKRISSKFKDEKRSFQIITPRNTGPLGVDSLNQALQESLNPANVILNEMKLSNFVLRRGDRIIIKKNDYERDIYNGDIGKVISIVPSSVTIDIDGRLIDISIEEIEEKLKLAYSLTVHRIQGQECPTIIFLIVNQHGKNLLQRNLLYTAITRAKKKVIVIGHRSAVERAINNNSVIKRNTKLGERLCLLQKKKDSTLIQQSEPANYQAVVQDKDPLLSEIEKFYPMATIEK
jgi:exodeoxyribonuclease V alpha subunit